METFIRGINFFNSIRITSAAVPYREEYFKTVKVKKDILFKGAKMGEFNYN